MKYLLSFFAGNLLIAGIVVYSAGKLPGAMFTIGFVLALAAVCAALHFAGLDRTGRFLIAMSEAWDKSSVSTSAPHVERTKAVRAQMSHEAEVRTGYRKPSPKQRDQILEDTISEYLPEDLFTAPKSGKVAA